MHCCSAQAITRSTRGKSAGSSWRPGCGRRFFCAGAGGASRSLSAWTSVLLTPGSHSSSSSCASLSFSLPEADYPGDGEQTRSFCYVSDLIEGIYRLLRSDLHDPVNLGNPEEYSILQFAEIVNELTGNTAGITTIDRSTLSDRVTDDPKVRCPDISRAKQVLGWEPQISLREGLTKSITHFRERVCPR